MFNITLATTSQAAVPGAERACTAIAVMTCAHWLAATPPPTPLLPADATMELWIRQGGALYGKWRAASQRPDAYAHATELVNLVSPALPIRCVPDNSREWSGCVSEQATAAASAAVGEVQFGGVVPLHTALSELLMAVVVGDHVVITAVLTVGALSVALRFDPSTGSCDLFDSHAQPEYEGKAIGLHFEDRQLLIDYLLNTHFAAAHGAQYSLTQLERRPLVAPRLFPTQAEALALVDTLPPNGFFYLWPCDTSARGSKEFAVAGLEDFWHHYAALPDGARTFYDCAREGQPVTFYADLEYVRALRDNATALNPTLMLAQFKAAVVEQWAEDHQGAVPMADFAVSDSSSLPPPPPNNHDEEEEEAMSISSHSSSSSSSAEEDEQQQQQQPPPPEGKVSYHVHNQSMWFRDTDDLRAFMVRVEQRCNDPPSLLRVWREMAHVEKHMFFADQSVYTRNRAFRLVGSSKWGQVRPFVPVGPATLREHFLATLLCPPSLFFYYSCTQQQREAPPERAQSGAVAVVSNSSSNNNTHALRGADVPPLVVALAQLVERHYKPERMRDYQFTPNALVTFFMVKHDCAICQDRHNNQCYVVVDLKTRMHWQKCMADRSKQGPKTPFVLPAAELTLACPEEMGRNSTFAADSVTATMVLAFARAVFAGAREKVPIPEQAPVRLVQDARRGQMYLADLLAGEARCSRDGGTRHLEVNHKQAVIRCSGDQCKSGQSRLFRPSHTSGEAWNLSFLFPDAFSSSSSSSSAVVPMDCNLNDEMSLSLPSPVLPDAVATFLREGNFFRALTLAGPAPPLTYRAALAELERYAAEHPDDLLPSSGTAFWDKLLVVKTMLTKPLLERCYRECLAVAHDFCYPVALIPRTPTMLLQQLFVHLARRQGFKRVGDEFYLPVTDARGRSYYRAVALDQVVSVLCSQQAAPNLCTGVLWSKNAAADIARMLEDKTQFPKVQLSKRYLGYANVVYDLQANDTLTWDQVRADPALVPFNFIDQQFPVEALERAKRDCPEVVLDEHTGQVEFRRGDPRTFVRTPLLDRPLLDQGFDANTTLVWLYVLLGRMFHYVGKTDGDGWEIALFLIGASGTFKSSLVALLKRYLQKDQFGAIPVPIEPQYPIAGLVGKLMVFMTECKGCTLDAQIFLGMATGDPVGANAKHKTSATVAEWDCPLLFAGNGFLNMRDRVGAAERRCAVFPFVRTVRSGQKDSGLVNRIFEREGALALIKWNTLYWAVRNTLREVRSHLPMQVQLATHQAIVEWDPLRCFLEQECILDPTPAGTLLWYPRGQQQFHHWCVTHGKDYEAVNWQDSDLQQMLALMSVTFVQATGALMGIRLRNLRQDPPFQSVFQIRPMDDDDDDEHHDDDDDDDGAQPMDLVTAESLVAATAPLPSSSSSSSSSSLLDEPHSSHDPDDNVEDDNSNPEDTLKPMDQHDEW